MYIFAEENPNLEFIVAYSGINKNLNGYSNQEMADMFSETDIPKNIVFEYEFSKLIKTTVIQGKSYRSPGKNHEHQGEIKKS